MTSPSSPPVCSLAVPWKKQRASASETLVAILRQYGLCCVFSATIAPSCCCFHCSLYSRQHALTCRCAVWRISSPPCTDFWKYLAACSRGKFSCGSSAALSGMERTNYSLLMPWGRERPILYLGITSPFGGVCTPAPYAGRTAFRRTP